MRSSELPRTPTWAVLKPTAAVFLTLIVLGIPIGNAAAGTDGAATSPVGQEGSERESAAADSDTAERTREQRVEERIRVVGNRHLLDEIPGSAHLLDEAMLERKKDYDIHRILRAVPGVNVREEDGMGLRPNIGMRGTGVERSQKITLMEDGILIAPAPYAAPAAYYFPTAGRMEAIEVLKGPSSIKYGPFTTGGTLNLLSKSIPSELSGQLDLAYGEHNTLRSRGWVGGTVDQFGWLLETYQLDSAGFKDLDGGGDTGVDLEDFHAKFRYRTRPDTPVFHSLELKLGRTEQFGEETYLGLTEQDFAASPFRRYAGSQEDWIDSKHDQVSIQHLFIPNDRFDLTTTIYRNEFSRNWHKLQSIGGSSISSVLDSPDDYLDAMAVLRGEVDSDASTALSVRNNRRNYKSNGIQMTAGYRLERGGASHDLEFGVRYHEDDEDRFQEEDTYSMVAGQMRLFERGTPGSQSNRVSKADAWALYVQDKIKFGKWTLRPGLRLESVHLKRLDFAKTDPERIEGAVTVRSNSVDELLPGFGVNYAWNETWTLFAGAHRGFSPPGPGSTKDTDPEESVNYEVGARGWGANWSTDLVGFFVDYSNLLGADTLSSGGTGSGDLFNGGEVDVLGLEASWSYDPARARGLSWSLPLRATYTWTDAEFRSSFKTGFADWAPEVQRGDKLPYLPEHQLSIGVGWERARFATYLDGTYLDEMRTKPGTGSIPNNERTDSSLVFDWSTEVSLNDHARVRLEVRNLTDDVYIAARRPAGLRPGLPRTMLLGFTLSF